MKKVKESIAVFFVAYMCIVFPLFYQNNYIDIMQAKRRAFLLGGICLLIIAVIAQVIEIIWGKEKNWTRNKSRVLICAQQEKVTIIFCLLLVSSWLVSLFLSIDKAEAFWGQGAKCVGLLAYLVGVGGALYLRRNLVWTGGLSWVFLAAGVMVSALQVLNRWGIDPLNMYSNLIEEQHRTFIGTIGQINYNAVMDGLIVAVLAGWFFLCRERFSKIGYGIGLFAVYCGAICCCSDSMYLSLIAVFYSLLFYVCFHPEKWFRLVAGIVLFDLALYALWFVWCYIKDAPFWGVSFYLFHMKLHVRLSVLLWLFIIVGTIMYKLCMAPKQKKLRLWKAYGIMALLLIPLGGAIAFSRSFYRWQFKSELEWADMRWSIWRKCWQVFEEAPIGHKLFGYGFNNVNQALAIIGKNQQYGLEIQDAHNIFLNSLVTSGLIGTALALGLISILLVKLLSETKDNPSALIGIMIIIVYFAQGILNGPQILTEPAFMVAFGATASILREKREI